jgi:hypothetical protein
MLEAKGPLALTFRKYAVNSGKYVSYLKRVNDEFRS